MSFRIEILVFPMAAQGLEGGAVLGAQGPVEEEVDGRTDGSQQVGEGV